MLQNWENSGVFVNSFGTEPCGILTVQTFWPDTQEKTEEHLSRILQAFNNTGKMPIFLKNQVLIALAIRPKESRPSRHTCEC